MGLKELMEKAQEFLPEKLFREIEETAKESDKPKYNVEKGIKSGTAESGTHPHSLLRNILQTGIDGRHRHMFALRNTRGEILQLITELDGEHAHTLEEMVSTQTGKETSDHQHVVRIQWPIQLDNGETLTPGTAFITDKDGGHSHGADMVETTNFDGAHTHSLKLDGGLTLESLDIKEFWNLFGPFDLSDISPIFSTDQIQDRFSHHTCLRVMKSYSGFLDEEDPFADRVLAAAFGSDLEKIEKQEVIFKEDEVQEVILSKKKFKTLEEAQDKLSDLDYANIPEKDIESQPTVFRAELKPPSEFKKDSLRTVTIAPGVKANIGIVKDKLIKKEADDFDRVSQACPEKIHILKQDADKQIVTGIVLEPDVDDLEGDTITEDEIQKAAAFFIQKSRTIGFRHKSKAKAVLIGSMVMPAAMTVDGPNGKQKVKKGTWMISIQVLDSKLWADVKAKRINALSVGGFGAREPIGKGAENDGDQDFGALNWIYENSPT